MTDDMLSMLNRKKIKHIKNDDSNISDIPPIEPFLHVPNDDDDDTEFYNIILTDGVVYKYQKFNSDDEELRQKYKECLPQLFIQRNECLLYIKELLYIDDVDLAKRIVGDDDNYKNMYSYNIEYIMNMGGVQITYTALPGMRQKLLASFVDVLNIVDMLIIDASTC